jgi:hypothetical protein
MARLGLTFPTRYVRVGIPPTEQPPLAPATAPIASGLSVTGGGRHGRSSPARALVAWSPRPLPSIGVTYSDSGTVTITITPSGADTLRFADAGGAAITLTPSGADSLTFTDQGATTITLTPSGSDHYTVAAPGDQFTYHADGTASYHGARVDFTYATAAQWTQAPDSAFTYTSAQAASYGPTAGQATYQGAQAASYGPNDGRHNYATDEQATFGPSDGDWTLRGLTIGDEA